MAQMAYPGSFQKLTLSLSVSGAKRCSCGGEDALQPVGRFSCGREDAWQPANRFSCGGEGALQPVGGLSIGGEASQPVGCFSCGGEDALQPIDRFSCGGEDALQPVVGEGELPTPTGPGGFQKKNELNVSHNCGPFFNILY